VTRGWRAGLGVALVVASGCKADFVTQASPRIELRADVAWPDTLARTDTVTLSVVLVTEHGDTLAGPDVTWTSSDATLLKLTPIITAETNGLPRRARAIATALVPGRVQVTVTGSRPGLNTSAVSDSVVVLERWIGVSAGDLFTCGLNVLHEAFCWGSFSWRVSGNDISPQRVAEGLTFSSISAGADYICGVREPSPAQAYCMGDGTRGALGHRVMEYERIPVVVGGGSQYSSIAAGQATTCAILGSGAGANCWGYAATGQLLDVDLDKAEAAPCKVRVFAAQDEELCTSRPSLAAQAVSTIVIARAHSCALYQPNSSSSKLVPFCWGSNSHGQLGIDSTMVFGYACQLREVPGFESYPCVDNYYLVTVDPDTIPPHRAIAAGGFHSCGVRSDGVASCWGLNDNGQLGDGTRTDRSTPVPVATTQRFATIVAAGARTRSEAHTCALTEDGAAYCWGVNNNGQLGDGSTTTRLTPVAVVGGHAFASLTAGTGADQLQGHTCGVRGRDGAIYCWGDNFEGQLGLGTGSSVASSSAPVRVMEPK